MITNLKASQPYNSYDESNDEKTLRILCLVMSY